MSRSQLTVEVARKAYRETWYLFLAAKTLEEKKDLAYELDFFQQLSYVNDVKEFKTWACTTLVGYMDWFVNHAKVMANHQALRKVVEESD